MKKDRIYIAGPGEKDELDHLAHTLNDQGWKVVVRATEESLRYQLEQMLTCDAVAVTETWWTDERAYTLQLISGWVGMSTYNHQGELAAKPTRKKSADA